VTVDPNLPEYGFLPEEWLDQEGNFGCTTDLVVSEIPADEAPAVGGWWSWCPWVHPICSLASRMTPY
jgi:hypothetical protein